MSNCELEVNCRVISERVEGTEGIIDAIDPGDGSVIPWNNTKRLVIQVTWFLEGDKDTVYHYGDEERDSYLLDPFLLERIDL